MQQRADDVRRRKESDHMLRLRSTVLDQNENSKRACLLSSVRICQLARPIKGQLTFDHRPIDIDPLSVSFSYSSWALVRRTHVKLSDNTSEHCSPSTLELSAGLERTASHEDDQLWDEAESTATARVINLRIRVTLQHLYVVLCICMLSDVG
jgi:hypothetical protein